MNEEPHKQFALKSGFDFSANSKLRQTAVAGHHFLKIIQKSVKGVKSCQVIIFDTDAELFFDNRKQSNPSHGIPTLYGGRAGIVDLVGAQIGENCQKAVREPIP